MAVEMKGLHLKNGCLSLYVVCGIAFCVVCIVILIAIHLMADKHQPSNISQTHAMKIDCLVKTTPVKNQGKSNLCWAYAMLATIESEHLMQGDSVNLSPLYIGRMLLQDKAVKYYLTQGRQPINTRGMASMLLTLIQQYGITHYDAFHDDVNFNVLARKTQKTAANCLAKQKGLQQLKTSVSNMLDNNMHTVPKYVFMLGAEYTTLEFARSVCRSNEYIALTSFTHHPFYQQFVLEVPDNHNHDQLFNLPIDTLIHRVEQALRNGHPVCWEGDISEPKFSFSKGMAQLEQDDKPVTQATRQTMFERFDTTDDHCMELIGVAHADNGKKFFLCKNSWGSNNPFGGMMFVSENYLRAKTIAVWMSNEALTRKYR